MFIRLNKRGQSTLEYGVIIAVVVAALLAMQMYMKRGLQGRLGQAADDVGEQFSPLHTTKSSSISTNVQSTETVSGGANPITVTANTQQQSRSGSENVGALSTETWD